MRVKGFTMMRLWGPLLCIVAASHLAGSVGTASENGKTIEGAYKRLDCFEEEMHRFKMDRTFCGKTNSFQKVVGGTSAEVNEWPWQVAIVKRNQTEGCEPDSIISDPNYSQVCCGGSLINERWILTAAHCDFDIRDNQVLIGNHLQNETDEQEQRLDVKNVITHPSYSKASKHADLALLELHIPLRLAALYPHIMPICLPRPMDPEIFNDVEAKVTGWGTLKYGGQQPNELQEADVTTMKTEVCDRKYGYRSIDSSQICAAAPGRDTCQGDSGGPLMTEICGQYYLIGVTSFGRGCANSRYPGVYARVTYALNWITETISTHTHIGQTNQEFCKYVESDKCTETMIKTQCIDLCKEKTIDSNFCSFITPDKCGEEYVKKNCPQMCPGQGISSDPAIDIRPVTGSKCPDGWFVYGSKCFLVKTDKRSWSDARAYCQALTQGADLAQPNDIAGLAAAVIDNGYDGNYGYWLGGSDSGVEGERRWLDGRPVTGNWAPGEPNGGDGQNCLYMGPDWGAHSLADGRCGRTAHFICQA